MAQSDNGILCTRAVGPGAPDRNLRPGRSDKTLFGPRYATSQAQKLRKCADQLTKFPDSDGKKRGIAVAILFILALLLAWPTFGLSLVAYVAFIVVRGHLIARTRMHYADQKQAERDVLNGAKPVPSWAGNVNEMELFLEVVLRLTIRQGVSPSFVHALFADKQTSDKLLFLAGAMERLGASRTRQTTAVVDKIVDMWARASAEVKTDFLQQDKIHTRANAAQATARQAQADRAKASRAQARGRKFGQAFHKVSRVIFNIWRIVAAVAVLVTMVYVAFLYATDRPLDGFFILTMAALAALGVPAVFWYLVHGDSGKIRDYLRFVGKYAFADLPFYYWFMACVLYLGGAGSALWLGAADEMAFLTMFGLGTGVAAVLLVVGFPGRLIAPKKYRTAGHIAGTALAALVVFAVYFGGSSLDQILSLAPINL